MADRNSITVWEDGVKYVVRRTLPYAIDGLCSLTFIIEREDGLRVFRTNLQLGDNLSVHCSDIEGQGDLSDIPQPVWERTVRVLLLNLILG